MLVEAGFRTGLTEIFEAKLNCSMSGYGAGQIILGQSGPAVWLVRPKFIQSGSD